MGLLFKVKLFRAGCPCLQSCDAVGGKQEHGLKEGALWSHAIKQALSCQAALAVQSQPWAHSSILRRPEFGIDYENSPNTDSASFRLMLGCCMVTSDLERGLGSVKLPGKGPSRPQNCKMTLRALPSGDKLLLEMLSQLEMLGATPIVMPQCCTRVLTQ